MIIGLALGSSLTTDPPESPALVALGGICRMAFQGGAWCIITSPVGRGWDFGNALTMLFAG